jgi:nitroreductase
MSVYDLVLERRTIRKFHQEPVPRDLLDRLLDAGRLAPVGGNVQPLEFIAVDDPAVCARVFAETRWAGYLKDGAPQPGEEPTAYLIIVHNLAISSAVAHTDVGIAAESITLAALDEGVASCMIGAMNAQAIGEILGVPEDRVVALVIALGYPAETAVMEEMQGDDDLKYWRDEAGVHHVPKRKKERVAFWNKWGGA